MAITTAQYVLVWLVAPFALAWYILYAVGTVVVFFVASPLLLIGQSRLHSHLSHLLAESLWIQMYHGNESWAGWRYHYSGDKIPVDETAVVIANHRYWLDCITIFSLAARKGRLGSVKFFAKKSISYIPGIGWGMYFLNFPFLSRDWAKDINKINGTFKRLLDADLPFWIVSHLEGTRMSQKKYELSVEYAKKSGKPILKHCLLPRTKGFVATVRGLRGRVDAIYDITLAYGDPINDPRSRVVPPSTLGLALSKFVISPIDVYTHVRRFPIDEIPTDEAEIAQWVTDRWVEKDDILNTFYTTGKFPSPIQEPLKHRFITLAPPPSEKARLAAATKRQ